MQGMYVLQWRGITLLRCMPTPHWGRRLAALGWQQKNMIEALVYGKPAPFPRGFSRGPAKSDGDDEWVPAKPGDGS